MSVVLNNLTISYNKHPAIHHLNGEFEDGSLTAIIGPNGAGKTSILKAISGLLDTTEGNIKVKDTKKKSIAYLPQQSEIDKSFPITALEVIYLGFWEKVGVFSEISDEMHEKAKLALEAVGLKGFENRVIGTLSAGQFQRVLFARTMVQDANLILLDEPFTAIDSKTTSDLLNLVHRWHGEKRTVIAVLHDMEQVKENFPNTLLVARECIAWGKTKECLTPSNLLKARQMMECWDSSARVCNI